MIEIAPYDSTADTKDHIRRVQLNMLRMLEYLSVRATHHDESKLATPEKEIFDAMTPRLRELTYGSDEYKACLAEMGEALAHHYSVNSHHPEHYENGINGMSLLDLVEMLADWKAASERHADGSMETSLEINRKRFGMSDQLAAVFRNTLVEMGWEDKTV